MTSDCMLVTWQPDRITEGIIICPYCVLASYKLHTFSLSLMYLNCRTPQPLVLFYHTSSIFEVSFGHFSGLQVDLKGGPRGHVSEPANLSVPCGAARFRCLQVRGSANRTAHEYGIRDGFSTTMKKNKLKASYRGGKQDSSK
jgi:hypothetical protein